MPTLPPPQAGSANAGRRLSQTNSTSSPAVRFAASSGQRWEAVSKRGQAPQGKWASPRFETASGLVQRRPPFPPLAKGGQGGSLGSILCRPPPQTRPAPRNAWPTAILDFTSAYRRLTCRRGAMLPWLPGLTNRVRIPAVGNRSPTCWLRCCRMRIGQVRNSSLWSVRCREARLPVPTVRKR